MKDIDWHEAGVEWGMEARKKGKPVTSNPYPEGSRAHEAWLEGWNKGQKS